MLSMKDLATLKIAIEICSISDLKKEILCAPGSDYDLNKGDYEDKDSNKLRWYEIVKKKATKILENLGLAKQLQKKVTSIIFSVGMRMLIWAEYHEDTFGLSREYSVNFLKNSFFTPQGIIDNKKAAEELIKDKSLNIKQKYKLACLYYFMDHIRVLFWQMTAEDKNDFYDAENHRRIKQPEFVKFWSYYLMSETDKRLKMEGKLDQYRLRKAVRSGSKTAVKYCLEKTKLRMKRDAVVDAAKEAVRCIISLKSHTDSNWVFRTQRYKDEELWVPRDYYVDILCFLFSKMGKDQQIELFKKEIKVIQRPRDYEMHDWALREDLVIGNRSYKKCTTVLEYFLNWPYQDYFMKKLKLMWEILSDNYYAALLLMICDKIESDEGENFDYRNILKEFWYQSPDRYKRHIFRNSTITYFMTNIEVTYKTSATLLSKLLTLKKFTYEDEEIIKLMLASATAEEKENILSSEEWTQICVDLMIEEKWKTLDRCTFYFFSSKEEERKFKRELSFRKKAQTICIQFSKDDNWNAAESFIKWSSLPEEEIKKLKKEIINSWYGLISCQHILFDGKFKAFEKFVRWYLSSEEEVKAFKRELIFSNNGIDACANFVEHDKHELVTELIKFCLPYEEEVTELKKRVAYEHGSSICKVLISDNDYLGYGRVIYTRISFNGGKWEEVEKFLTWCFSSEEEINDFKKNKLLKEYGEEIHFELIKSYQWEEAETFFAWLGLSFEEIKELKKRTLFDYVNASKMFGELIESEDDEKFIYYGNKLEAIGLLLRWYLTDKEIVLECKDKFFEYPYQDTDENNEVYKKIIDKMIEQRLREIDDENMGVKRKAEVYLPKEIKRFALHTVGAKYDE